jgi:uncharacterized membrane protein YphA (DoxX/SURF4 family)
MSWAALAARVLVGAAFLVFGLNGFFNFIAVPTPPDKAARWMGLMYGETNYLRAVKALEVVGGVLLLSGRMAPLGLTVLTPIAVNVLFFELFLTEQPGPGYLLVPLCGFLIYAYRRHFAGVFTTRATVG